MNKNLTAIALFFPLLALVGCAGASNDGDADVTNEEALRARPAKVETFEGTLTATVGIGGENTGASLATSKGLFELVLDARERASFVDERAARVKGTRTLLSGVETSDRPAIDVTEILVCPAPGYVNCMPGPRPSNPLCSADARSWITASCPGVDFAD